MTRNQALEKSSSNHLNDCTEEKRNQCELADLVSDQPLYALCGNLHSPKAFISFFCPQQCDREQVSLAHWRDAKPLRNIPGIDVPDRVRADRGMRLLRPRSPLFLEMAI